MKSTVAVVKSETEPEKWVKPRRFAASGIIERMADDDNKNGDGRKHCIRDISSDSRTAEFVGASRLSPHNKPRFYGGGLATLTSVAYTSAEVFDPTNADAIKAFQLALKNVDKGVLFLLADEPENTAQAKIETTLPAKKVKLLADVEIAQREGEERHQRELEVVREQTKGAAWVEVLKYVVPAIIGLALGYFGR